MQLTQRRFLFVLVGALGACSPDTAKESDWLLGTFSDRAVGESNVPTILHFEFRADGVLVVRGVSDYGKTELEPVEYAWERLDEDQVEVVLPEPYGDVHRWRITPTSDCRELQLESFDGGAEPDAAPLYRGKTCLALGGMCPGGTNCDANTVVWCDEPPPRCDDDEEP